MIKLVRLDERLIHGQVAAKLLRVLDVDTVVVVDDESANNKLATQALLMATVGAGVGNKVKTSVKDTDTAIRLLNDPRCEPKKIIIVCRYLDTLKRIVNEVTGVEEIDIGNYGRVVESSKPRTMINKSLSVDEDEAEVIIEMIKSGKNVYIQMTPDSEKIETSELLKKLQ